VGIFFVLLLFLLQPSALGNSISEQFFRMMASVSSIARGLFGGGVDPLRLQLERLQEENRLLREKQAELESLREENEVLRRALASPLAPLYRRLATPARVIGVSPTRSKEVLYVAIPQGTVVREGNTVVLAERTLVGRVSEIFGNYAAVETILDPEVKIAAKALPGNNQGLFIFKDAKAKLSLVAPTAELKEGDIVVTSGQEGTYPEGLLLGIIKAVERRPAEPFLEAELTLALDLSQLGSILILEFPPR
jgi:rod shape-determining protein MreC